MSHEHLEGAVKNLLAIENHALPGSHHYGCPHCITKHFLITEQLLEEENQQRPDNGFTDLISKVKDLRVLRLPKCYEGEYVNGPEMENLSKEVRGIRLEVMKRAGLPMHEKVNSSAHEVVHGGIQSHKHMEHEVIG